MATDDRADQDEPPPSDEPARSPNADDDPTGAACAARTALVDVVDRAGLSTGDARWLQTKTLDALRQLGAVGDVRIAVVRDAEMVEAHERSHADPSTTDVITFNLSDASGGPLDADLLVCLDEAARRAGARAAEPRRELLLYIVHGVLHCLGEDDRDPARAAAMHRREDEVLQAIGVGPVYAEGAHGAAAP